MPRTAPSVKVIQSWIKDIPEIKFEAGILYCNTCRRSLECNRKSHIREHIASQKHKLSTGGKSQSSFNFNLMEVMVGCNIPWKQLNNPLLRQFLQKCINGEFTDVNVPTESTLRKNYLSPACDNIKTNIFSELGNKYIWMSVQETTDASGRLLANVMVGEMDENSPRRAHLIACKVLETINADTVGDLVHTSLREMWGDKYVENVKKLLLFITDAAPYTKLVGSMLKETYSNMLHMTCLAHALNRVAETIGTLYPNVNNLISSANQVFQKSHLINVFQETLPTTQLPPEYNFEQWETWLEAASYYYSNLENIQNLVQQLDTTDATTISDVQQAFSDSTIQEDLAYIHAHFSKIPVAIRQLQRSSSTVNDTMNALFDLRHYLFQLSGGVIEDIKKEIEEVLNNNPGFITMCRIVDLLSGIEMDASLPSVNAASLKHFKYFKYAPVTSVHVERSFSELKWIFADRRRILSPEHLEAILVVHSYNSQDTN